jgi:hypothetical protein
MEKEALTELEDVEPMNVLQAELKLNDTQTCKQQFGGECCQATSTAFGARVCLATDPADCARDADGKLVFNADVTIGGVGGITARQGEAGAAGTIVLTPAGVPGGSTVTFVEFGVTDFPQCAVFNSINAALGPFGPFPVHSSAEVAAAAKTAAAAKIAAEAF